MKPHEPKNRDKTRAKKKWENEGRQKNWKKGDYSCAICSANYMIITTTVPYVLQTWRKLHSIFSSLAPSACNAGII
jgi:hypothetical protein